MASPGLLTNAQRATCPQSPQFCGFTSHTINSLFTSAWVLYDVKISYPVTLGPGHGLKISCRRRPWPTHWLTSSIKATNTPEVATGWNLCLGLSTLIGLWLQYNYSCHPQPVGKLRWELWGRGGQSSSENKRLSPGTQISPWYYCQREAEARSMEVKAVMCFPKLV